MTYHEAYIMAYEKCKQARDEGKPFVGIQKRRGAVVLLAQHKPRGLFVGQPSGGICEWTTRIANRMATAKLCDLPVARWGYK